MKPKHNAFYGYVIALAIVSSLLVKLFINDNVERRDAVAHSADYFSVGYQKWQMNAQGGLETYLTANKMTHYSDDSTMQLENPLMFFYNAPHPAWEIQSETGKLSKEGDTLWLNGKVAIKRTASPHERELIIHTSNLIVTPQTHFAQTGEFTELRSGKNITTGLGMKATFNAPVHLELLAKVHGIYDKK